MENRLKTIDTKKIADLAKLSFTKEELSSFQKDMTNIVSFAATVAEAPSCEVHGDPYIKNVLREDCDDSRYLKEDLLSVAPESCDGFFKVPKAFE